jgi:prepilin-type N-terminal cleavage/methylation domain-containing protein
MTTRHHPAKSQRAAVGFTLMELLVVLTIIAILTAIGLLAAHHVRQNSQVSLTKTMITSLDAAYNGFTKERDSNVLSSYKDDQGNEIAVADACVDGQSVIEPSLGLFVLATGQDQGIKDTIVRADARFVSNAQIVSHQMGGAAGWTSPVAVPVLKDPWGNAIRFVHPRYAGGYGDYLKNGAAQTRGPLMPTLKRAAGSAPVTLVRSYAPSGTMAAADEGMCSGNVGYFYSAGVDGNGGTRDDNVYSNVPRFPTETAALSPAPAGS